MHQGEHGEERDDGWDGSLDSAIERLTAAATRLQGGDEAAQGEFDKWDKIVAGRHLEREGTTHEREGEAERSILLLLLVAHTTREQTPH